jgi:hypothetical protein
VLLRSLQQAHSFVVYGGCLEAIDYDALLRPRFERTLKGGVVGLQNSIKKVSELDQRLA